MSRIRTDGKFSTKKFQNHQKHRNRFSTIHICILIKAKKRKKKLFKNSKHRQKKLAGLDYATKKRKKNDRSVLQARLREKEKNITMSLTFDFSRSPYRYSYPHIWFLTSPFANIAVNTTHGRRCKYYGNVMVVKAIIM